MDKAEDKQMCAKIIPTEEQATSPLKQEELLLTYQ
jgi:hypothetical protein